MYSGNARLMMWARYCPFLTARIIEMPFCVLPTHRSHHRAFIVCPSLDTRL